MNALAGRTVLVAEDEPLLQQEVADTLTGHGARVVTTDSLLGAFAATESALDHAVLDIHLADGDVHPVAARLSQIGVPMTFLTNEHRCEGLSRTYREARVLQKPALPHLLLAAVRRSAR